MSQTATKELIQVTGHGNSAQLMIIGDYPTEKDLVSRQAFSSYDGALLKSFLNENNFRFNDAWKTTYIKGEIDKEAVRLFLKNKKKKVPFNCEGIDTYKELLLEEMKKLKPRVCLAVGELALNFLTGEYGVGQFAGSVLPLKPEIAMKTGLYTTLVVPILHPRDLNKQYKMRFPTRFFIGRAIKYLSNRYVDPAKKYVTWVAKRQGDLRDYLNRQVHKAKYYTSDIETFRGFITCAGFCFDGKEAVSVPLLDEKIPIKERAAMFRMVLRVWESKLPLIGQNFAYDDWVNSYFGIQMGNIYDDTMLLAHSMYPELPKNLGFLTSIYTEMPYFKDEGKEFDPSLHHSDQLYLYNAKDCISDYVVYEAQVEDAKTTESWPGYSVYDFHREKVWPMFHIYKDMDHTGMRVDKVQRQVLFTKYATYLEEYKKSIETAIGQPYNYNSPQQASEILYEMLCLPKQYAMRKKPDGTKHKTLSADEKAIDELVLNHIPYQKNWTDQQVKDATSLLQLMGLTRKIHKALEFLATLEHPDGRMRSHVKIIGTKSGRTSGEGTVDFLWEMVKKDGKWIPDQTELGLDFKTVPKHGERLPNGQLFLDDLTSIFVPDDGFVLLEGDKSQAEARVVCVLADDYDQLELFDSSDIHLVTTSWIVGVPLEKLQEFAKNKELFLFNGKEWQVKEARQAMGKPARHGGNFDMGEGEISHQYHIPSSFAKLIIDKFHNNAPNIRNVFHAGVRKAIDLDRCLVAPSGRRRDFFDRITNQLYKAAFSFIPQATVSDHVKFDMLRPMHELLRPKGVQFINERHDSLLTSCPRSMVNEVAEAYLKYGATPIDFSNCTFKRNRPLVIPTDLQWSDTNWKEMKDWKKWKV